MHEGWTTARRAQITIQHAVDSTSGIVLQSLRAAEGPAWVGVARGRVHEGVSTRAVVKTGRALMGYNELWRALMSFEAEGALK